MLCVLLEEPASMNAVVGGWGFLFYLKGAAQQTLSHESYICSSVQKPSIQLSFKVPKGSNLLMSLGPNFYQQPDSYCRMDERGHLEEGLKMLSRGSGNSWTLLRLMTN